MAALSDHLFPQKYDAARDAVFAVPMDARALRAASFLDDRILVGGLQGTWQPAGEIATAAPAKPLHFIFHTGHVGSTLLSRLIDEAPGTLGLREPLALRSLAQMHDDGSPAFAARLALFLGLWGRGFADTRAVVVKASSVVGRIAPQILDAVPAAKAVYLNLRAEPYFATLLAGANTPIDLAGFADERRARLRKTIGDVPPTASLGELAAMTWLVESLARATAVAHGRVLALDFDAMLADVPRALAAVLAHLGIAGDPGAMARSAVLTRYSKAPQQFEYSPGLRHAILAQARRQHANEIRRGLIYLERLAARAPAVAALF